MGEGKKPGPLCSTRIGDEWIDEGTLCRAKTGGPGPAAGAPPSAEKRAFDTAHVYSLAPEARRKRAIDLEIIAGDYSKSDQVRADSEEYLKKLIFLASGGDLAVQSATRHGQLQFFFISGGAEGFLPNDFARIDANRNETAWEDTDGNPGRTDFDENDLLAVFGTDGKLVGSARLRRPTYVQGNLSRKNAAAINDAWHNKTVFIYKNDNSRRGWIPYLGLGVEDGFRSRKPGTGRITVDIHKEEATNGCILIEDPNTPDVDSAEIRTFEPKLIHAILAAVGLDEKSFKGHYTVLGKMKKVRIKMR